MLNAEELGVSREMLELSLQSARPEVKRLLGAEGNFGEQMGLTNDWVARIIRRVGNYGDVYERNVGAEIEARHPARHQPALDGGGIMYAPPIR